MLVSKITANNIFDATEKQPNFFCSFFISSLILKTEKFPSQRTMWDACPSVSDASPRTMRDIAARSLMAAQLLLPPTLCPAFVAAATISMKHGLGEHEKL